MMSEQKALIEEMNKFLKGTHMGAQTFRDYIKKSKDEGLKDELVKIIEAFKKHEECATSHIKKLGGEPADTTGLAGELTGFLNKIKNITVNEDIEVLDHAIKAMHMGIQQGNTLLDGYKDKGLDSSIFNDLRNMVNEYTTHKKSLEKLRDQKFSNG